MFNNKRRDCLSFSPFLFLIESSLFTFSDELQIKKGRALRHVLFGIQRKAELHHAFNFFEFFTHVQVVINSIESQ